MVDWKKTNKHTNTLHIKKQNKKKQKKKNKTKQTNKQTIKHIQIQIRYFVFRTTMNNIF